MSNTGKHPKPELGESDQAVAGSYYIYPTHTMVKILVVDDHPLVIDGISAMLRDVGYIRIAGAAKTAREALEFLKEQEVDVILLDINLPDMDGMQLCETIRAGNKTVRILGLTSANEAGIITQLLHRGANGYLLKNMEREELIEAVDKVMDGKIFLSKAANEKVLQLFQSIPAALNSMPILTRREKEILQLLSEGLNGPQIAEKLFLSTHTVETHRKNLLQKFNVHNTQLLIKKAGELRLL